MIGKFGSNNFMSLQLILMKLHKITKFVHVYWTTLVIIESFCFNNTKHTSGPRKLYHLTFWITSDREIATPSFSKRSVFKMLFVQTKTIGSGGPPPLTMVKPKAGVFKFLWFKKRSGQAPFSWRIIVDGRPNPKNKAAFSNLSRVVWTGPKMHRQHKRTRREGLKIKP